MEVETRAVKANGIVVGSGMVMVPRALAESKGAIPSAERVAQAKARFEAVGLSGARLLIEALQMLEKDDEVVGYFGFTVDRHGVTRTPLAEGESDAERLMKVMRLPHPEWGSRRGTATAIGDLVSLSEDPKLESALGENAAIVEQCSVKGRLSSSRAQVTARLRELHHPPAEKPPGGFSFTYGSMDLAETVVPSLDK